MNEQAPKTIVGKSGKSKLPLVILVILLLGIAALLIWIFSIKTDMKLLLAEKEMQRIELQGELDSLMNDHELIKAEYGTLSDSLHVKDSIIQANATEIRKLLDTQWEYYKVKKKLELLQQVSQGYVRQMDSLYRVNAALTEENAEIREDLRMVRREKDEISKDREMLSEKVDQASILQTYNLIATAIRDRAGKERETDKASRLDKIKVCFTLGENKIIEPGTKEIYIRIAQPDKLILTRDRSDEYTFMYKGEKIQYSIKKLIDYRNNTLDLCLYWEKISPEKEMQEGTYHIEVFYSEEVIGHTQLVLK